MLVVLFDPDVFKFLKLFQILSLACLTGGIASVYVGQPLDTVKVKMQTFPTLYKNGLRCFLQTYAQDGIWKGLYAGKLELRDIECVKTMFYIQNLYVVTRAQKRTFLHSVQGQFLPWQRK